MDVTTWMLRWDGGKLVIQPTTTVVADYIHIYTEFHIYLEYIYIHIYIHNIYIYTYIYIHYIHIHNLMMLSYVCQNFSLGSP